MTIDQFKKLMRKLNPTAEGVGDYYGVRYNPEGTKEYNDI